MFTFWVSGFLLVLLLVIVLSLHRLPGYQVNSVYFSKGMGNNLSLSAGLQFLFTASNLKIQLTVLCKFSIEFFNFIVVLRHMTELLWTFWDSGKFWIKNSFLFHEISSKRTVTMALEFNIYLFICFLFRRDTGFIAEAYVIFIRPSE